MDNADISKEGEGGGWTMLTSVKKGLDNADVSKEGERGGWTMLTSVKKWREGVGQC